MILDFVDLSSDDDDDDDVVVAREEHNVHGKGHLVHVEAEFVDLTSDEDIVEGEHLAYGQGKASQGTQFLKQEFVADDEEAEVVQCRATLQMEALRADHAQAEAAQCTATLQMEEHIEGDGQGDAAWSTGRLQMQELRADHGQGDAIQCTTTLQMQELRTDDVRGDAAHCATTVQRQELSAGIGQNDAARCIATLQMQKLLADDLKSDASQCTTTLQRQELTVDVEHGDAAQCTETLMQELGEDVGKHDAAQRTMTLQRQELTSDDGQGDAAQFTPTLERQELTQDNEQGDAISCTSTSLQRQQLNADDGQDAVALCRTTLPRQKSISDGAQGDVTRFTTAVQRQESDMAHAKSNTARCTTLQRQKFLAADDCMQEAVQLRSSAESTTSLLRTQEGSHRAAGFLNTYNAPTAEPFPRQFWKAGDYGLATQASINRVSYFLDGQNRLRIHPKFLHSNATSHKWAFGAIAELLDNAIDEVNNGATFVKIDKMKHSPDGDYALVIEDNGGGMSPESLRQCMSFGFSQKCTDAYIGRYGNGFKTSTMRLGADAMVFTCTKDNRRLTRSVGLLSYTFLMKTKCNDILVPAVDYEFDASSSTFKRILNCGEKHFSSNLSTLLRWCPFSTEGELLNQFSRDMECHGTKIIVFNLWFNDALEMELDFKTEKQDIMISGAPKIRAGCNTVENLRQMHVANRFRYSLRVYASILYLHVPKSFQIILCGRAVEPHYAVNDLIFRECIKYRPQVKVTMEVDVIIGYLRDAPQLDIYGFNVYHKNRLILPYWRAGSCDRRRGIAGVLEANFIRPTHDKQDFERTDLFQRLETRLKDMATEYWTYHCHLVGYTKIAKRPPPAHYVSTTADRDDHNLVAQATTNTCNYNSGARPFVALDPCSNGYNMQYPLHNDPDSLKDQTDCAASINVGTTSYIPQNAPPQQSQTELHKRRKPCSQIFWRAQRRRNTNLYSDLHGTEEAEEVFRVVLDQNTMLKTQCSELEEEGKKLACKAEDLRKELSVWRRVSKSLTDELQLYNGLEGFRRGWHHSNPGIGFI